MRKLYLIAGHDLNGDPGAIAYDLTTEASLTAALRDDIARELTNPAVWRMEGSIETDNDSHKLIQTIRQVNTNAEPHDLLLDIHFNYNHPTATGSETFYATTTGAYNKELASRLSHLVAETLEIPDRGAKPDTMTQHRRLGILQDTVPQACLLEVCFLNKHDLNSFRMRRAQLVTKLADFYRRELSLPCA